MIKCSVGWWSNLDKSQVSLNRGHTRNHQEPLYKMARKKEPQQTQEAGGGSKLRRLVDRSTKRDVGLARRGAGLPQVKLARLGTLEYMLGLLADALRYEELIGKFSASHKSSDLIAKATAEKEENEANRRIDISFGAMALLRFNAAMDNDDVQSKELTNAWLDSAPRQFKKKYRRLRDKRSAYYAHRGLLKKGKRRAEHTVTEVQILGAETERHTGIEWTVDPWMQDLAQRLSNQERNDLRELARNAFVWVKHEYDQEYNRVAELAMMKLGKKYSQDEPWVRIDGTTDGVTDELKLEEARVITPPPQ